MLFFRSEDTVKEWCQERSLPVRPILDLEQLWFLAQTWYSNRMTVESGRPEADQMLGIFESIGLEGPFWDPG